MESKEYVNPFIDVHKKADALRKRARQEHEKDEALRETRKQAEDSDGGLVGESWFYVLDLVFQLFQLLLKTVARVFRQVVVGFT